MRERNNPQIAQNNFMPARSLGILNRGQNPVLERHPVLSSAVDPLLLASVASSRDVDLVRLTTRLNALLWSHAYEQLVSGDGLLDLRSILRLVSRDSFFILPNLFFSLTNFGLSFFFGL